MKTKKTTSKKPATKGQKPRRLAPEPCSGVSRISGAAVRSVELVLLQRLISLIDIRRRSAQRELKAAIANKQWSKVPGWDGIDIGLMMAETTLKEEMQQNDKDLARRALDSE